MILKSQETVPSRGSLVCGKGSHWGTLPPGTDSYVLTASATDSSDTGLAWAQVSVSNMKALAASSLLGNATAGSAVPTAISLDSGLSFSGTQIVTTALAHLAGTETLTGAKTFSGTVAITGNNQLALTNTAQANGSVATIWAAAIGADSTLGALNVKFMAMPSATGGNRWYSLYGADNSAVRTLMLNTIDGSTFGATQAGALTAASAIVTGALTAGSAVIGTNLTIDSAGRLLTDGAAPTAVLGTGASTGGSPSATITGNDRAGQISILTGTAPAGNATVATVTFALARTAAPRGVFLFPINNPAMLSVNANKIYCNVANYSTTQFVIQNDSGTGLTATTTYTWGYLIIG